jgi:hypothetical protein
MSITAFDLADNQGALRLPPTHGGNLPLEKTRKTSADGVPVGHPILLRYVNIKAFEERETIFAGY